MKGQRSLYDSDDYYADDASASRLSPYLNGVTAALMRLRARSILRVTRLTGGLALDVGAGEGGFLAVLKRRGFQVYGTTLSERSQRAAKANYGIDLQFAAALPDAILAQRFDLVTYWHVYEHLDEPQTHVERWPALVRPGGFLVLEVPNIASIGAKLCFDSWLGSDSKHHINHCRPRDIRETLVGAGFEVVAEHGLSAKFSYVFLWSALLGALFGKTYRFDGIMALLKEPGMLLRTRPLATLNALFAVFYLAPVIALLLILGPVLGRGEIYRVYARRP